MQPSCYWTKEEQTRKTKSLKRAVGLMSMKEVAEEGDCRWRWWWSGLGRWGRRTPTKVPLDGNLARAKVRKEAKETYTEVHVSVVAIPSSGRALNRAGVRAGGSLRNMETYEIHDPSLRGFPISSNSNSLTTHSLVILLQNGVSAAKGSCRLKLTTWFIATT
jgi:hypothetical protein